MIQGAAPARYGTNSGPAAWIRQHPGILVLLLAAVVGLIVLPAIAGAVANSDVTIAGRVSLIDVVWLIVALALCLICLGARASMSRDLGDGLRQLIARLQASGAADAAPRAGSAPVDLPGLGAAIVRGIFDLVVLLVIQGIVRVPLVGVVGAYQPKALVDGVFVALVVLIALIQLYALYRAAEPLTLRLVSVGLDRLVPTAGFAAGALVDAPPTRTLTAASRPAPTARGSEQPTVAAPSPDLPTVAAGATVAGPAEATVLASDSGPLAAEATVVAPTGEAPASADATVAEVPASPPPSGDERTLVEERTLAGESTILAASSNDLDERQTRSGSEGRN